MLNRKSHKRFSAWTSGDNLLTRLRRPQRSLSSQPLHCALAAAVTAQLAEIDNMDVSAHGRVFWALGRCGPTLVVSANA